MNVTQWAGVYHSPNAHVHHCVEKAVGTCNLLVEELHRLQFNENYIGLPVTQPNHRMAFNSPSEKRENGGRITQKAVNVPALLHYESHVNTGLRCNQTCYLDRELKTVCDASVNAR